jgi:outer membrane murein-binding lipoprotein Lpp
VKSKKTKLYAIRCTLYAILAGCLLAAAAGCESTGSQKIPPAKQIQTLKQEKKQLARQIEQSKAEAEQLKKQIQVLSDLPPEVRFENLYHLQKTKITRYTNLYDKDKDGKKEKLIVYIQPIDEEGDIVKATGDVDVQLWDLNKENGEALLGQWQVKPDELKKLWFATLITINYRLTFDVTDKVTGDEEALTVKVTFTDYLTGKVFTEQKVIKPR